MTALLSQPEQANGLRHRSRGHRPRCSTATGPLCPERALQAVQINRKSTPSGRKSNRFQAGSNQKLELETSLEPGRWNLDLSITLHSPCLNSQCTFCEPKLYPTQTC